MSDPRTVAELVHGAIQGDELAWNGIVDRFMPLVRQVLRKYNLGDEDAQDVNQTLWLRLVEHLGNIREPPALPAWIVTTTRNEALRVLAARRRSVAVDPLNGAELDARMDCGELDGELLQDERRQALRAGLAELKPHHQELLRLLMADPPLTYDEISNRLGISVGSIGPTRARALEQLRHTAALQLLVSDD